MKNSWGGMIFCILGAGASVDSGLATYRGPSGLYTTDVTAPERILNAYRLPGSCPAVWEFVTPLYQQIATQRPGPTYAALQSVLNRFPHSLVMTQNIDGYALSLRDATVVEIHGNARLMRCLGCNRLQSVQLERPRCEKCAACCRPDFVMFNESLDDKKVTQVYTFLKGGPQYALVIGTTLQFPYLRRFINKAKARGCKVIHINPDPSYRVIGKEQHWQMTAVAGLKRFLQEHGTMEEVGEKLAGLALTETRE